MAAYRRVDFPPVNVWVREVASQRLKLVLETLGDEQRSLHI